MGLYGTGSDLCERRCREYAFQNQMHLGREVAAAGSGSEAAPQALRAETAEAAVPTVETGVARNGIGARALAVLSRFRSGNGSER